MPEALEQRLALSTGVAAADSGHKQAAVSGYHVERGIPYTADGGSSIDLDLYVPNSPAPAGGRPAVVAFPGGGWRWASRKDYGKSIGQLAQYGYVVAVADYTYSSGAPGSRVWPANFEDSRNAVRWVRSHAESLNVNPDKIAAAGVSSGAYLANMLGVYPNGPIHDNGEELPPDPTGTGTSGGVSARVDAVVDFYGPVDMPQLYQGEKRTDPYVVTFLGGTPSQYPNRYEAASVDPYISSDDPPFFIVQGTADRAVPFQQSVTLSSDLTAAGVQNRFIPLKGYSHGFMFSSKHVNLLPPVLTFLNEALNNRPISSKPVHFIRKPK